MQPEMSVSCRAKSKKGDLPLFGMTRTLERSIVYEQFTPVYGKSDRFSH